MDYADYDKALYYTHRSQWDNLLILMVRTEDDLLSKRIEHFLHAYHFEQDYAVLERRQIPVLRKSACSFGIGQGGESYSVK